MHDDFPPKYITLFYLTIFYYFIQLRNNFNRWLNLGKGYVLLWYYFIEKAVGELKGLLVRVVNVNRSELKLKELPYSCFAGYCYGGVAEFHQENLGGFFEGTFRKIPSKVEGHISNLGVCFTQDP